MSQPMTVRELIEKLEEFGDDMPVYFILVTERNTYHPVVAVDTDSVPRQFHTCVTLGEF